MDPVFEAATKRIDELKQELKTLEEFVGTYRKIALGLRIDAMNITGTESPEPASELLVDKSQMEAAREAETLDERPQVRVRVRDNPKPFLVVAAALEVIRERDRPMSRREIHTALAQRGIVVRGADEVKALGTMLWRSGAEQLVQLEGLGYWDKSKPFEPAGYDPNPVFDTSTKEVDTDVYPLLSRGDGH